MALINCPRCGGKISERAQRCPHCGGTKQEMEQIAEEAHIQAKEVEEFAAQRREWEKNNKKKVYIALAIIIGLAASIITFKVASGDSCASIIEEQKELENGHEYIDLGLSVKWATCNVGATKPEEYGDYFAWGETQPKDYYSFNNYKWGKMYDGELTKYCSKTNYGYNGFTDNKTTLDLSDDAARANWGGNWRMPTRAELTELREKCTWKWTIQNGVRGYKVTSKSNGNSIFLPAAGSRSNGPYSFAANRGIHGVFWSSTLGTDYQHSAYFMNFDSGDLSSSGVSVSVNDYRRYCGFSVRPVCP